jgi:hypothetical protein
MSILPGTSEHVTWRVKNLHIVLTAGIDRVQAKLGAAEPHEYRMIGRCLQLARSRTSYFYI